MDEELSHFGVNRRDFPPLPGLPLLSLPGQPKGSRVLRPHLRVLRDDNLSDADSGSPVTCSFELEPTGSVEIMCMVVTDLRDAGLRGDQAPGCRHD